MQALMISRFKCPVEKLEGVEVYASIGQIRSHQVVASCLDHSRRVQRFAVSAIKQLSADGEQGVLRTTYHLLGMEAP
jgi:hypothetical protein